MVKQRVPRASQRAAFHRRSLIERMSPLVIVAVGVVLAIIAISALNALAG